MVWVTSTENQSAEKGKGLTKSSSRSAAEGSGHGCIDVPAQQFCCHCGGGSGGVGLRSPQVLLPSEAQLSSRFLWTPSYDLWVVLGWGKRGERPCWDLPAFSTLLHPHLTPGVGKYIPESEFSQGVRLSKREHPASHQTTQTPPLPLGVLQRKYLEQDRRTGPLAAVWPHLHSLFPGRPFHSHETRCW